MKMFVLSMLLSVSLATVAAVALARALLPPEVWEKPSPEQQTSAPPAFGQHEALEVVGARLGTTPKARQMRRALEARASVSYHSRNHWTVRVGETSWTAHGAGGPSPNGRYAEPDNQAARALEAEASGT
jgi:hypothetical protein